MANKRKCQVNETPAVQTFGTKLILSASGWSGKTQVNVRGEMSMYCASQLVRNLRRAMRSIRDDEIRRLNDAVNSAEGPL